MSTRLDARLEIAINVVASELEESERSNIAKRVDPMDALRRHAWICVIDSIAAAMRADLREFKLRFRAWPEQPFDPYGLPNPEVFPTLTSGSVLACDGRSALCWIGRSPGIRFEWIKADEHTVTLAVRFWPRSLSDFDDSLEVTIHE